MANSGTIQGTYVLPTPAYSWHVHGLNDFNGDGRSDILLRNDNGSLSIWQMANSGQVAAFYDLGIVSTGYHVAGTGDFNGDGRADILWRHDNGSLIIWDMANCGQAQGYHDLGVVPTSWHVDGTGDYNGDGRSDILMRNDNGSLTIWDINGSQPQAYHDLGVVATSWHVQENSRGDGNDVLPVILDLDDDGVEVTPLYDSSARFDMNNAPGRERTAWAGPDDGFLAVDLAADGSAGPDGVIDQTKEIVFAAWAPGATSDMAALRQVFDTDHNGTLDANDARWNDFAIWQDANGDGVSQPGEVKTLGQRGIASIDLTPAGPARTLGDGSVIGGVSNYTRTDGTTGVAGDVSLAFDPSSGADLFAMMQNAEQSMFGTNANTLSRAPSMSAAPEQDAAMLQLIQAMAIHSVPRGALESSFAAQALSTDQPALLAQPLHQ